jgi:hypothetical protein
MPYQEVRKKGEEAHHQDQDETGHGHEKPSSGPGIGQDQDHGEMIAERAENNPSQGRTRRPFPLLRFRRSSRKESFACLCLSSLALRLPLLRVFHCSGPSVQKQEI